MLHDILFALWFFLPAAGANAAPIPAAKFPIIKYWNAPIDGNLRFRGKPLLGPHKTWRGLAVGIISSTILLGLEQLLVRHFAWAQSITRGHDYIHFPTLFLGPLFAIGALGGDAIKSFFKRQRGTKSGETWIPFDQTDYIIGGAVLTTPYIVLSSIQYVWLFLIWFVMHLLVSYLGYLAHLKDKPI